MRSICGKQGVRRSSALLSRMSTVQANDVLSVTTRSSRDWCHVWHLGTCEPLTVVINPPFYTELATAHGGVLTDELKIFRDFIHFVPLKVGHNDVYLVATSVVHAAKEHEFGKLSETSELDFRGTIPVEAVMNVPC